MSKYKVGQGPNIKFRKLILSAVTWNITNRQIPSQMDFQNALFRLRNFDLESNSNPTQKTRKFFENSEDTRRFWE